MLSSCRNARTFNFHSGYTNKHNGNIKSQTMRESLLYFVRPTDLKFGQPHKRSFFLFFYSKFNANLTIATIFVYKLIILYFPIYQLFKIGNRICSDNIVLHSKHDHAHIKLMMLNVNLGPE